MNDIQKNEITSKDTDAENIDLALEKSVSEQAPRTHEKDRRRNISRGRKPRSRRSVSEFDQKVIDVRRVARVVAGGRRFNFSVVLVLGDRKGRVGVGIGKAADTARAIDKAIRSAKKNMITAKTTPSMSISHEVAAKFGSARVVLIPAKGRGLVAGSSVRTVLDLGGFSDIAAKVLSRSKNKLNNARATIDALQQLRNTKMH